MFLLFVVFFIYGVLGVGFFGEIQYNDFGIDRHANFHNIGNALLGLFRVATGDAWEELRDGTSVTTEMDPNCAEQQTCGAGVISPLYFISFTVIGASVMLELLL